MKNISKKGFAYFFISIALLAWVSLAIIKGVSFTSFPPTLSDIWDFILLLFPVTTIVFIAFLVFAKWGWKYSIFRGWLIYCPDLSGTWTGHISSDWEDPEVKGDIGEIATMLTIKQTLLEMSCVMRTKEMISRSSSEDLAIDSQRQIKRLSYIYRSEPHMELDKRSTTHYGAIIFDLIEKPEKKLIGQYWTARKTRGKINLEFHSEDVLEQLPDKKEKLPPAD